MVVPVAFRRPVFVRLADAITRLRLESAESAISFQPLVDRRLACAHQHRGRHGITFGEAKKKSSAGLAIRASVPTLMPLRLDGSRPKRPAIFCIA